MIDFQLYKDIAKHDNLEDLYKRYYEVDKEVESAKGRRIWLLIAFYFLISLLPIAIALRPHSVSGWFLCVLLCVIPMPFHFLITLNVHNWYFHKNREDNERRERILLRIKFAEEYQQNNQSINSTEE